MIKPTDSLTVTPRLVYQKLKTNGFPRVDLFNMLANPYTTTQPAVSLGKDEQYTQLKEGIDDDFKLGDLKIEYDFGGPTLTSISSYTDRKVTVVRDATALTGSITFDIFGAPGANVRLSAPLIDKTKLKVFSQELRLSSSNDGAFQWLAGVFYQDVDRRYGQDLPVAGYDTVTGVPGSSVNAPADTPYHSYIKYSLTQFAAFGEGTYHFTDQWNLTGGLRYYDYKEDRVLNFGGFFADVTRDAPASTKSDGLSPRAILGFKANDNIQFNLQASRGFRLGGINDPINKPICSPSDLATFGSQDNFKDEKLWNYELGTKMLFADRRVSLDVAAFYSDITDLQATLTAGSCNSRIVYNVPKARSQGIEAELLARLSANWDIGASANWADATLRSTVTSTDSSGNTFVIGGFQSGSRLPTAPRFQAAANVGYTLPLAGGRELFANLTVQYTGSSYSRFENENSSFGQIGGAGGARIIPYGAPTFTQLNFEGILPSYETGNFRMGVRVDNWEVAGFINNLWDERANLATDYERGLGSARFGYIVNQPRTIGASLNYKF